MLVAIVGVCASGKTTLVKGLREAGFDAYNVAQEHSCIKKFWNRKKPDVLIMIDATLSAIKKRRFVTWDEDRLVVQHERLRDARENANLYIQTDELSREEVLQTIINFIRGKNDVKDNDTGIKE
jgi:broad-specificity NMP kinase